MKQLINQITELLSDNNLIIKSDEYAKNENSAYTNDYYGYFNGAKDMGETILQKIKDHNEVNIENLQRKRGFITVERDFLNEVSILPVLFSVFYPVVIRQSDNYSFYDTLIYSGYSPYFDEIDEGKSLPEYVFYFKINEDNKLIFDKCEKK